MNTEHFSYSAAVREALDLHKPVVALESTVIAHGLPHPQNLETARRLEQIVTEGGAIAAIIAILQGVLSIGLNTDQVKHIAESREIKKISTRDLPIAVAQGWDGATTVATTCWIAQRAGIHVFATGGIGGVHRGSLPDVSADLPELERTPIIVVCSGAKIVLDLPATREWLETHGVTVLGYQCDELPAFYSRKSGLPVDVRVESADQVAQIYEAQRALGIDCALLVTVPVPAEAEVPAAVLENILDESLAAAAKEGIGGRELTPFLLSRMARQSKGATLRANIALLENNARVATAIASTLATGI